MNALAVTAVTVTAVAEAITNLQNAANESEMSWLNTTEELSFGNFLPKI